MSSALAQRRNRSEPFLAIQLDQIEGARFLPRVAQQIAIGDCGLPGDQLPRNLNRASFGSKPSPVHSAHVGQELEVHYRWHPYFGHKVVIRRAAQRATGRFLSIMGPAGVVLTIADWMLDPIVCVAMPAGTPRVDLAALVELKCY